MNKSNLYFAAGFLCALSMFGMSKMFFSSEDGKNQHRRRKKVVCFGDSITQHGFNSEIKGWVTGLANWWTRRVDVINRGYSGYNSKWGKFMVQNAVIVEKPDLLFIFFGANDAIDLRVLQHVPLAEYKQNMESIVTQVQKALPHTKIILITPPPVWEETLASMNRKKLKAVIEDRTNERTFTYVTACKSLGTKHRIPVVDIWTNMEGSTPDRQYYLSDGLHLSVKGNDKLLESIKAVIQNNLPEWTPEMMSFDFPEWSQVSLGNPSSSFN